MKRLVLTKAAKSLLLCGALMTAGFSCAAPRGAIAAGNSTPIFKSDAFAVIDHGGRNNDGKVQVDKAGFVYVSYAFENAANQGRWDIGLARFSPAGKRVWQKTIPANFVDHVPQTTLRLDSGENLLLGAAVSSGRRSSIPFLKKYTRGGDPVWSTSFGRRDQLNSVSDFAVAANGDVVLAAQYFAGDSTYPVTLHRFSSAGKLLMTRQTTEEWATAMALDGDHIYVVGGASVGGNPNLQNAWLARYDGQGKRVGYRKLVGGRWSFFFSVAVGPDHKVYAAGFGEQKDGRRSAIVRTFDRACRMSDYFEHHGVSYPKIVGLDRKYLYVTVAPVAGKEDEYTDYVLNRLPLGHPLMQKVVSIPKRMKGARRSRWIRAAARHAGGWTVLIYEDVDQKADRFRLVLFQLRPLAAPEALKQLGGPPPQGTPRAERKQDQVFYKDGKPLGTWIRWYANGRKKQVVTYKEGKLHGPWTCWYQNGQKSIEGTHNQDKRVGTWTWWNELGGVTKVMKYYDDGQKKEEADYYENQRQGKTTKWYPNGKKRAEEHYRKGKRNGVAQYWYYSGVQRLCADYSNGQPQGTWSAWGKNGFLTAVTVWNNGRKVQEKRYQNGKLLGTTEWDAQGDKVRRALEELGIATERPKPQPPPAKGPDINALDQNGATRLHVAASKGQVDVAKFLIDKGADVNVHERKWAFTPLHMAAKMGHKDVVELLLANGADVQVQCMGGPTPLDMAVLFTDRKDVVELLVARGGDFKYLRQDGRSPLHSSVRSDHWNVAEWLINRGADVNTRDKRGSTVLHHAVRNYRMKNVVDLLLQKGADVRAVNNDGATPVHFAAEAGHNAFVKLLIDKGAEVNVPDKKGWTPLHYARCQCKSAELLIEHGANVKAVGKNGETPMHVAASKGQYLSVNVFIAKRLDVNVRDNDGLTPMHYAARVFEGCEAMSVLIRKGANIEAVEKSGKTPLHLAAQAGHAQLVKLLIIKKANVNARDNEEKTPLALATNKEVRELLEKSGAKE